MLKNIKVVLLVAMSICIAVSFTGCSKKINTISDYKKKGIITVGTNAQFPPFEFYETEKIVGLDMEIAQAIANKLGVELAIEDMNFNTLPDALQKERIDFIVAGMSITDSRKEKVTFSDSYYKSGQSIALMGNNTQITKKEDLTNKKIGVQNGTTGAYEATKIEGAEILEYNTVLAAIMDMKLGNIDAVIFDLAPLKKFTESNPDIKVLDTLLTEEDYGVAVRKEETELLATVNEVIKEMKDNGVYDQLVKKYFD